MKQCNKCKEDLIAGTNFNANNLKYSKYICRSCEYKKSRKWELDNPIRRKELYKHWRTKHKGVYGIFSGKICLYVGESNQLNGREGSHLTWMKNEHLRKHSNHHNKLYEKMDAYDNKKVRVLEYTDNHVEREYYWKNKLNPLFNIL